jgi:hypothetical protein
MGTWGGAERVVQPTDLGLVGFRISERECGDREEDERGSGNFDQGLLEMDQLRFRLLRLSVTLMAIAATALAGGASLKGY